MDDDTEQAAWSEQALQERHRREDELLERCRPLQAELGQILKDMNAAGAASRTETNDGDYSF